MALLQATPWRLRACCCLASIHRWRGRLARFSRGVGREASGREVAAGLPGFSTVVRLGEAGAVGQVTVETGLVKSASWRADHAVSQGQRLGRCRWRRRAEVAIRAGT